MPHSLILNLLPVAPIPSQFLTGRHLHALFLNLVSAVDSDLSAYLHDQSNEKAFTLSPFQVSRKETYKTSNPQPQKRVLPPAARTILQALQWEHKQAIGENTAIWWRISLLDDGLFDRLTQLWQQLNFERPWHLGPTDLYVTNIVSQPTANQPWVNFSSYAELFDKASETERQIAFTFCTPTNFRQGVYDSAMPSRESVFGSLANRWNKYSEIAIESTFTEAIFPSFFDIRTEVCTDSRSKFIGCVGEVSYRIMGDVNPLAVKQINALADFALYSGVGRKTPMGMGMTRRLPNF
ncbi:MAG: CRISPR-associated endoribonuclease Cas6 [Microcoleus sp. PH2017_29_MFU_D_A]|uniref:CRISPR-associated endoribonuclease Cas6 n=1 Tax=unclassified Microcoleus TaxID=2642155 RepID=UPI001D963391|nr:MULTISPECIES: CRISPR-associated endoribonuclease Cas6 [unclassified Microcoleus]MCC3418742.1 CRISPR-associated endoribonuclease Cas6 [Microcoleus sp. PH2017_07_MST_O_A]MCC3431870.1 CRISPR-associated endoribonuclease Cas6 [Microcoleus sp. PH2017_04_SCI_O_A]MCC3445232.1 CRISPR-associated endoribonuclease Cas6 [Microcoleus sp. PH2017_03_ELD_O_A]MCC3503189.1 CRISPR-associated endoribonuclease Cas6 [Microcoleus sp. PH2017_19_SFW_U_A]TAE67270.1 MAG: CRISPR-associated endoribonuclease Cas6 [Oscill